MTAVTLIILFATMIVLIFVASVIAALLANDVRENDSRTISRVEEVGGVFLFYDGDGNVTRIYESARDDDA